MKFQIKTPQNPKANCRSCPQRNRRNCDLCGSKRDKLYKSKVAYFEKFSTENSQ